MVVGGGAEEARNLLSDPPPSWLAAGDTVESASEGVQTTFPSKHNPSAGKVKEFQSWGVTLRPPPASLVPASV